MAITLFVLIVVNLLVFSLVGIWAVRNAVGEELPRVKPLLWGIAAVALAFVLGAGTRLLMVSVRLQWLDGRVSDFLLSEWHFVQTIMATALGIGGFLLIRRFERPLRQADRIATAVADRLPTESLDEAGLTPRELEVLQLIGEGKMSDQELAEALYISPATAGTHVKNILRKVGVSSRRDLAVLAVTDALE